VSLKMSMQNERAQKKRMNANKERNESRPNESVKTVTVKLVRGGGRTESSSVFLCY
jgi:hypothetical protein